MARKVVLADASPLIALARVGGLPWLRKLYKSISITEEVRGEATRARELPGAVAIAAAVKQGWIRVLRQEWSEPPLPLLDAAAGPVFERLAEQGFHLGDSLQEPGC